MTYTKANSSRWRKWRADQQEFATGSGWRLWPGKWCKNVIKNIVGDSLTLRNTLGFVEAPVNAEIDSTLPVLFFRLRQVGEMPRHVRPHVTIAIFSYTIEFIGDEHKRDIIRSVETANGLEERSSNSRMPGGIGWKRRSKVRPIQITGRCAQWCKGRIPYRSSIAVAEASGACANQHRVDCVEQRGCSSRSC